MLLVLDDDPLRSSGFAASLPQLGSDWTLKTWSDPAAMLSEIDGFLPTARLVTLEAANAQPIVDHLAARKPSCPVLLYHQRNRTRDVAWALFKQLRARSWDAGLISGWHGPRQDLWYSGYWLDEARELLHWRTDTRANRVHAANCDELRQFEGREAIYVEKYFRRVRVSHIRAHVDSRHAVAWAEEILAPGLGAPGQLGAVRLWRFGGGYETRFSRDTWSNPSQFATWHLYFAPDVIAAVLRFAETLPPEQVYANPEMHKLIWRLTDGSVRAEKPVFPS